MKSKKHILILDDDIDIIKFLVKVLENAGYATHYATSLEDFNSQLNEIGPHLLIIDFKLGQNTSNAIHLIEKLKKNSSYKSIPTFLISGSLNKKIITMATQLGADEFIAKPIQTNIFLQKIKKSLKLHELPEINFDKPKTIKCQSSGDIAQISESTLRIKGPVKFAQNVELKIHSSFLEHLGSQVCRYHTQSSDRVLGPGLYLNEIRMIGVKEETTKKIRLIKATIKNK